MRSKLVAIAFIVVAVAALAFAGGRMVTRGEEQRQRAAVADVARVEVVYPARQTSVATPAELREIAQVPFAEAYRLLKTASPEMLRIWAADIEQIPVRPQRWAALGSFFKTLVQVDGATTRKMITELRGEEKFVAMMAVKDAAPPRALKEVAELLLHFDGGPISGCSYDYLRTALEEWSEHDPVAVKGFIETNRDAQRYAASLLQNWAAIDPEAAKAWMTLQRESSETEGGNENESDLPDDLEPAWVQGLFYHDRSAALDYLLTHEKEGLGRAISDIALLLFSDAPDEARSFILKLPEDAQSEALYSVSQIAERLVYGDADDERRSPEFLTNWMMQFPAEAWEGGLSRVFVEWKYKDTQSLFAWMAELPAGTQERVVAQYRPFLFDARDAEKEFNLVMSVAHPELRYQLLQCVMRQANESESRALLLAAVANAPLSNEQKSHLGTLLPEFSYEVGGSPDDD